jgi:hypothetical protein
MKANFVVSGDFGKGTKADVSVHCDPIKTG